jgi:hypothetical protein
MPKNTLKVILFTYVPVPTLIFGNIEVVDHGVYRSTIVDPVWPYYSGVFFTTVL